MTPTQLLLSPVRKTCWKLLSLNPDGSTAGDVSGRLISFDGQFTEEIEAVVSNQATFVLDNSGSYFSKFGTQAGAALMAEGQLLSFQKGFVDPDTGLAVLWPAFYGVIASGDTASQRSQGAVITVRAFDLMYYPLKQSVTTDRFVNTQANAVASIVAARYARFTGTNLAALDYRFAKVDFPDFPVASIFQDVFEPALYLVWADYAGNLATFPRLGSGASGSPGLLGYSDATSPPPDADVAFTFPDASLLEMAELQWQNYDAVNQITTLGQDYTPKQTLGPVQILVSEPDSSIGDDSPSRAKVYYQNVGAGNNALLAQNVLIVFRYSTNHALDTSPRYVVFGDTSLPLPPGVPSGAERKQAPNPGNGNGFNVNNEDPHIVGNVIIQAITQTYVDIEIDGWQFTGGSGEHHGGFDFNYDIWGQPVQTDTQTLTAIVDYAPVAVQGGALSDVFGDGQTWQFTGSSGTGGTNISPVAMGTPVGVLLTGDASLITTTLAAAASAGDSQITVHNVVNTHYPSGLAGTVLAQGVGLSVGFPGTNVATLGPGDFSQVAGAITAAGTGLVTIPLAQPLLAAHSTGAAVKTYSYLVSADNRFVDQRASVDWERGRLVLATPRGKTFEADSSFSPAAFEYQLPANTHGINDYPGGQAQAEYMSMGTGTNTRTLTVDPVLMPGAAPAAVYSTYRQGDFVYQFSGLTPGASYNLTLHFAEPQASAGHGYRVMDIFINDSAAATGVDPVAIMGGNEFVLAYPVQGCVALGDGTMTLHLSPTLGSNGNPQNSNPPLLCGFELFLPQGQGTAGAVAVNCGGPTVSPPAGVAMTADFAYSPLQQLQGIQNQTVDNPLLNTFVQCLNTGRYTLNYHVWGKNPVVTRFASIPPLFCGQCVKFFHPGLGGAIVPTALGPNGLPKTKGADVWQYVQQIERTMQRPDGSQGLDGSGSVNDQGTDTDTLTGFILFIKSR